MVVVFGSVCLACGDGDECGSGGVAGGDDVMKQQEKDDEYEKVNKRFLM